MTARDTKQQDEAVKRHPTSLTLILQETADLTNVRERVKSGECGVIAWAR